MRSLRSQRAALDLGLILAGQGKMAEALPRFEAAITSAPISVRLTSRSLEIIMPRASELWREPLLRAAQLVDPAWCLCSLHLRR